MKKSLFLFAFTCVLFGQYSLAQSELSVEKIMKDPKWMGNFPSNVRWDEQGKHILFNYNPEGNPSDSLYKIAVSKTDQIEKVTLY